MPELTRGMPQSGESCCQMVDITPAEGQDGNSNAHLLAISFELLSEGWLLCVFPLPMLVFFFGILEDKTSGYLGCRRYHKCSVEQFFKIYLFFMFMSALSSCTAL